MTTNINIDNQGPSINAIATSVSSPLSNEYWGISADGAPAGATTKILWMSRNEGITEGQSWQFTSAFTFAGVSIQLEEYLTGTARNSDISIQIVAGSQSTGFQSEDTSLTFTDGSGNTWVIAGHFFLNGAYDDVTYTMSSR